MPSPRSPRAEKKKKKKSKKDVDETGGLTKRKIKTERRRRRWQAFRRRRRLLGFDDVPEPMRPRQATRPTPVALSLREVGGWSVPRALRERIAGKAEKRSLRCALSLSFFDCGSRRFFGGTWMGRAYEPLAHKKHGGLTVQTCELVHWCTRVDDPACVAVIELVACEVDPHTDRVHAQYGCGWTYMRLFGGGEGEPNRLLTDTSSDSPSALLKEDAYEKLQVYDGTPRRLVTAAASLGITRTDPVGKAKRRGDLAQAAGAAEVRGCHLVCRARRHDGLLRCAHLVGENEVVSVDDMVPGLVPWCGQKAADGEPTLALPPDGREVSGKRPMLGATIADDSRGRTSHADAWHLFPNPKPKLATEHVLHLDDLRVKVPERGRLEQALLKYIGFRHDPSLAAGETVEKREKIVGRRLAVGLHNGRAMAMRRTAADGFVRIDLVRADGDVLAGDEHARATLPGYVKHALYAVVVALEYEIRPAQKVPVLSDGRTAEPITHVVTLGLQAYIPFDGKKLRLRTGADDKYIEVELQTDDTCRALSRYFVFPPAADAANRNAATASGTGEFDAATLQRYAAGKLVGFELTAMDGPSHKRGKDRALHDETPDRASDQSSDEEIADDEELGESAEEGWASEDDESSVPRRRKPRSSKRPEPESEEDDLSTLAKSVVSGDSRRSDLRYYKPKRFERPRSPKKKGRTHRWEADEYEKPRKPFKVDHDADGWRRAAPGGSSMLASLLGAPLHRADGAAAQFPKAAVAQSATLTTAVGGPRVAADDLSRAQRSRLARNGYPTVQLDDARALVPGEDARIGGPRYDLELERSDPLALHEVTFQFAAFRGVSKSSALPRAVYFTFQFYTLPPTRTERLRLCAARADDRGGVDAANDVARLLVRDRDGRRAPRYAADDEPPLILKFSVDTSTSQPNEGRLFAEYLACKALHVDVWDADSRLHVGTAAVPLDRLLRQRAPVAKVACEHPVVAPYGLVDEGSFEQADSRVGVRGAAAAAGGSSNAGVAGAVVGHVQVVCCNYGEEGAGVTPEASKENEPPASLDWRRGATSKSTSDLAVMMNGVDAKPGAGPLRSSYGGPSSGRRRPGHRVRARPLAESSPELSHLLASRDKRGGLFAKARSNTDRPEVSEDANAVTYDEVLTMVRRFRDDAGRVKYAGPLLALLEAPNLKALERQLVRVLTKAEQKGTSLEKAFAYFDADHGGTISVVELEDALRALGCFRGAHSGGVVMLLKKFDLNGDGVISLDEFIAFVRRKQKEQTPGGKGSLSPREGQALEARVKAILLKAEELGVSVVDAFHEFDADGNGNLNESELYDALKSLGTMGALTKAEVRAFVKLRDADGNGTLEISELLSLMGRTYADHLVLKLKRILDGVERRGVRIADAFASWDADKGGTLSRAELIRGLRSLGVFKEMTEADVKALLDRIDADNSGEIDVKEFYAFAGFEYAAFVEARVKAVLRLAERKHGVPLEAAFREWDKDRGGSISLVELKAGLDGLGVFRGVQDEDIAKLLQKLDDDNSGEVSLAELLKFCGCDYAAVLARRLRSVLLAAEARGTRLEAAFKEWDADDSGTITHEELKEGLRALGTFADMSGDGREDSKEVDDLVRMFDKDGDGDISVRELLKFMGRDPAVQIEAKLRQIVHASGIGAAEAFKHFDKDGIERRVFFIPRRASRGLSTGDGSITRDELAAGLRELPGLEDISNREAAQLAKLYDADGNDEIDLGEFTRQLGASAAVGEAEEKMLQALRTAVTKPRGGGRAGFENALENRSSRGFVDDVALKRSLDDVGVDGVEKDDRLLVLSRFATKGGTTVASLKAFAQRGGVGTPDEIARGLGEPSASPPAPNTAPAPKGHPALGDSAAAKLAQLLLAFEDGGADLAVAFRRLDPDRSGAIDADELFTGLRTLGDAFADFTAEDARRVVRALDQDNSGDIDLVELRNFARAAREDRDGAQPAESGDVLDKVKDLFTAFEEGGGDLKDAFARLDKDGDGRLDARELRDGLRKLGDAFKNLTERDAAALLRAMDDDNSGTVEIAELVHFARGKNSKAPIDRVAETAKTLRAVLRKARQGGASLEDAFKAFDSDRSGKLSVCDGV